MNRFVLSGFAALLLMTGGSATAVAHPHVFIDNRVVLHFEGGKLVGFRTDWRFDEIFTEDMMLHYDADADGAISAAESAAMGEGTLPNLASFRYFTHVSVDGTDYRDLAPSAFAARKQEGALHFELTFTLPAPVDPRTQALRLEISDREYYVEVLLAADNPIALEGAGSDRCEAVVRDDPANAYYGGFVIPQAISVSCQ
ncbi:ABC-type uncharacterized transport system substrate-binding protein [Dongia mobilis]|uniref:ABC-type uncharacterized transport system substrate-binding protein n=2 Tax=Dongia mobilis TaxID=578943 RepID=A0A4R6WPK6_9PROT|nr:ABC-type uncharacterized transport system substrate-binding protein [Dongia mobilis]